MGRKRRPLSRAFCQPLGRSLAMLEKGLSSRAGLMETKYGLSLKPLLAWHRLVLHGVASVSRIMQKEASVVILQITSGLYPLVIDFLRIAMVWPNSTWKQLVALLLERK